jgi:hypothetical protein
MACRFENTLVALRDCAEHMTDPLKGSERRARRDLLETCMSILLDVGVQVEGEPEIEGEPRFTGDAG